MPDIDPQDLASRYLTLWQRNLSAWAADSAALGGWAHLNVPRSKSPVQLPSWPVGSEAAVDGDGRAGPRPLPAHLGLMYMAAMGGFSALPLMSGPVPLWHPSLQTGDAGLPMDDRELAQAVGKAALAQLREALDGLAAYRVHPYHRHLETPPTIWQEGTTRLLDYGATKPKGKAGRPVLVIPSLVNPAYILDLREGRSLMRHLAEAGLRPLLMDWQSPGPEEMGFDLDCYIVHRLEPALEAAAALGDKPIVMGYCMGGTLAAALAARQSESLSAFVALAAPWDFSVDCPPAFRAASLAAASMAAMGAEAQAVPLDMLQIMFASLDPSLGLNKFRHFARLDPKSEGAEAFVALEDWANDGMPLAGPAAAQVAVDWYVENRPPDGTWEVGGEAVNPADISVPSLIAVPHKDRLVPPASAQSLAEQIPGAALLQPKAGHVGMIVGSRAVDELYRPLADWLTARA